MAIKSGKSFSPYKYGVKYRVVGSKPNYSPSYVPAAGGSGTEMELVVSKMDPNFFTAISNKWYYGINENDEIQFLKCISTIAIVSPKIDEYENCKNVNSDYFISKYVIKNPSDSNLYNWASEKTLDIINPYDVLVDVVVLLNNDYYNEYCNISFNENSNIRIDLMNKLSIHDSLIVLVYPVTSSKELFNTKYTLKSIPVPARLKQMQPSKLFLENPYGNIDYKYLVFNSKNELYNLESYNVEPSYIEFEESEVLKDDKIDISHIYAYSPNNNLFTYIIQYGIDTNNIKWNKSRDAVEILHNLNCEVNFIFDRHDDRKMVKFVKKIDNNTLIIEFLKNVYLPNVFSFSIFKIGDPL